MTAKKSASEFYLHTPARVSQSYVQWAEELKENPGITFGCAADKTIIPLHPGDLMAVVARPSHGKSSWMAYMAKREADSIVKRGKYGKEAAVYVSWEQPVEEIEAFFQSGADYTSSDMAWGRVPMETIVKKSIERVDMPLWVIGTSIRNRNMKKPPMTVDVVYETIAAMKDDFGIRPTLVCLDYIQKIPVRGRRDRVSEVTEATYRAKELAMHIGAPIIAGVQASRGVDQYKSPIPTMADAQWSSAVEQTADKQISVWRPARTHPPESHPQIEIGGTTYANSEYLFVIKLLKQRFERGYGVWPVHFKPHTLELYDHDYWVNPV